MASIQRKYKNKGSGDTNPRKRAGAVAPQTDASKSNFDELTPEQQDCVRERFAWFVVSIMKDSQNQ
jgi:hypothetical protein